MWYCEHCDNWFEKPGQTMRTTQSWSEERGSHSVNYFEDCCPKCGYLGIWLSEEEEEDEDNK